MKQTEKNTLRVFGIVLSAIFKYGGVEEPVFLDTELEDIAVTGHALNCVVAGLENRLNTKIAYTDIYKWETVRDIVNNLFRYSMSI